MTTTVRLTRQYISTISFAKSVGEDHVLAKFRDSATDDPTVTVEKISIVHTGPVDRGLAPVKAVITISWDERL